MSVLLSVQGVSKSFPGVQALDGVDFELRTGEVHALVGENGAGKSTLMHILAGIYRKDEGTITVDQIEREIESRMDAERLGLSIVFQESSLLPNLTVAENLFSGEPPTGKAGLINWPSLRRRATDLLAKLQLTVDPFAQAGTLSTVLQKMIEIVRALSNDFRLLILDEPTASITVEETEQLFGIIRRLRDAGKSIIYISHRLKELQHIADRVTVLRDGKYVGTYDMQAISEAEICEKMVGRQLIDFQYKSQRKKRVVLEVNNLTGHRFQDVNLRLCEGEFLTITGLTGAGRTELALTLFGVLRRVSGSIVVDGEVAQIRSPRDAMRFGIGYVTEDRNKLGLFEDMSIMDNMTSNNIDSLVAGPFYRERSFEAMSSGSVRDFNIKCQSVREKVRTLSGGNRQKVCLSRWISYEPRILIVDEPTLGVDVGSKEEIYNILNQLTGTGVSIIMISSDMIETLALGDRIVVMHAGTIAGELEGNEVSEEQVVSLASGIELSRGPV